VGRDRKGKRVNLSKWSILNDFSAGTEERKRHLSLHKRQAIVVHVRSHMGVLLCGTYIYSLTIIEYER